MMALELGLFFFVLLGSKIVLGCVLVYMLLPRDPECSTCDAETLPLETPRGMRRLLHALRLQRRWCMECQRETLARQLPLRRTASRAPLPVAQTRVR